MIGIETENGFQQCDGTSVPDTALDSTSTNSVQNKVITNKFNAIGAMYSYAAGGNSQSFTADTYKDFTMDTQMPSGRYVITFSIVFESRNGENTLHEFFVIAPNFARRFYNGGFVNITMSYTVILNVTSNNPTITFRVKPSNTFTEHFTVTMDAIRIS